MRRPLNPHSPARLLDWITRQPLNRGWFFEEHDGNCRLTAPEHLKSRALLMTIYAAGLRRSEVARLRVSDIDSERLTITIHQGKGQKDRVVMLSPVLLDTLRQYWRKHKPKEWLFPGRAPDQPISGNDIFMVFQHAVGRAGITKKVCPHLLRAHLYPGSLFATLRSHRSNSQN